MGGVFGTKKCEWKGAPFTPRSDPWHTTTPTVLQRLCRHPNAFRCPIPLLPSAEKPPSVDWYAARGGSTLERAMSFSIREDARVDLHLHPGKPNQVRFCVRTSNFEDGRSWDQAKVWLHGDSFAELVLKGRFPNGERFTLVLQPRFVLSAEESGAEDASPQNRSRQESSLGVVPAFDAVLTLQSVTTRTRWWLKISTL